MKIKRIAVDSFNPDPDKISEAAAMIRNGGLVALPTETVYGLAALKDNPASLERLYSVKQRPRNKPFTVHLSNKDDVDALVEPMPPYAYRFIERYWPGPLTIVAFSKSGEKIGLRCPDHLITQRILKEVGQPVVIPSANLSGYPPAVDADEIEKSFSSKDIDLIVDAGRTALASASTVIDLEFNPFKMIREGAVLNDDLLRIFITKRILFVCTGNTCRSVAAEYLLKLLIRQRRPDIADFYEIKSVGVCALETNAPSRETVEYLLNEGLDVSFHRSRRLNLNGIRSSDIILVMEKSHRDHILEREPTASERIFMLSKFLDVASDENIADPIGGSYPAYQESFGFIKEAVTNLTDWL